MPSFSIFSSKSKSGSHREGSITTSISDTPAAAMSTISISSTSSHRPDSRDNETGFPDSFSKTTTSMRHPDARADYSLGEEDIDPARFLQRSHQSMLAKHRRTISQGSGGPTIPIPTRGYHSVDVAPSPSKAAALAAVASQQTARGSSPIPTIEAPASPTRTSESGDAADEGRRTRLLSRWLGGRE